MDKTVHALVTDETKAVVVIKASETITPEDWPLGVVEDCRLDVDGLVRTYVQPKNFVLQTLGSCAY